MPSAFPVSSPGPRITAAGALARAAVTGLLCGVLVLPGDALAAAHTRRTSAQQAADSRERTLHALNRFSFGPRPGEVAAVDRSGLDAWFQQQLHPESIPDEALEDRLSAFPAMQLSQAQLVERLPPPNLLKQVVQGNRQAPEDPVEHAIWEDAALGYQVRRENKAAQKTAEQVSGPASTDKGALAMAGSVAPNTSGPAMDESKQEEIERWYPGEVAALLALPPETRFARIVALTPAQFRGLQRGAKGAQNALLTQGMAPGEAEAVAAMRNPEQVVQSEVTSTRLLRDVYSQRQLQAVMVDFWLNHFSVYLHKNQNEPYMLPAYEREVVLPHALGQFEDLLVATAQSPAMLLYLDNAESVGPDSRAAGRAPAGKAKAARGINENYARELMELHTLGVGGGYSQQDVIEVAKCFTGWTIDRPGDGGGFQFNPARHEPGPKTVLGHVIPEGGVNEGLAVLHILATSPATAHFVSLKLAQRFVSDTPPPALVNRMAATFLQSQGDMRAVLTTLWRSPEFWAPATERAKLKTPVEFLVSALRATDADVTNPQPLVQAMARLGMPVYGMQTPNGYSWESADWVSSNALITRMNLSLVLAGNRLQGTTIDWSRLLPPQATAADAPASVTEGDLEEVLLDQPATPHTRAATLASAATTGIQQAAAQSFEATASAEPAMPAGPAAQGAAQLVRIKGQGRVPVQDVQVPESPVATMAGLLLGSPDFQRR